MRDVRTTDHELRRCNACGYENVRNANRARIYGELPCHGCRGVEFTVYDPVWVQRGLEPLTTNHEEPLCLPTS